MLLILCSRAEALPLLLVVAVAVAVTWPSCSKEMDLRMGNTINTKYTV